MAYLNIIICGVGDTEVNISIIYIIILDIRVEARDVYTYFALIDAVVVCAFGRRNINLLCLRLDKVNTREDYLNYMLAHCYTLVDQNRQSSKGNIYTYIIILNKFLQICITSQRAVPIQYSALKKS